MRPHFSVVVLIALAAACGSPPDMEQELVTVASWSATGRLALAEHGSGALPNQYVAQLKDRATTALAESRTALAQAVHTAGDRRRANGAMDSLSTVIRQLDRALAVR